MYLIYAFTVLQGVFIFIFQILLNDKAKTVLSRGIKRRLPLRALSSLRTGSTFAKSTTVKMDSNPPKGTKGRIDHEPNLASKRDGKDNAKRENSSSPRSEDSNANFPSWRRIRKWDHEVCSPCSSDSAIGASARPPMSHPPSSTRKLSSLFLHQRSVSHGSEDSMREEEGILPNGTYSFKSGRGDVVPSAPPYSSPSSSTSSTSHFSENHGPIRRVNSNGHAHINTAYEKDYNHDH